MKVQERLARKLKPNTAMMKPSLLWHGDAIKPILPTDVTAAKTEWLRRSNGARVSHRASSQPVPDRMILIHLWMLKKQSVAMIYAFADAKKAAQKQQPNCIGLRGRRLLGKYWTRLLILRFQTSPTIANGPHYHIANGFGFKMITRIGWRAIAVSCFL